MARTTKAELDQLVVILNNRLGRPQYGWDRATASFDRFVCRVGAMTLDRSYGGNRLHEVVNEGGGVREIGPRLPAGQMADFLRAMLEGIALAEINVRSAAPHLDGLPSWGETPAQDGPHGRTSPRALSAGVER